MNLDHSLLEYPRSILSQSKSYFFQESDLSSAWIHSSGACDASGKGLPVRLIRTPKLRNLFGATLPVAFLATHVWLA